MHNSSGELHLDWFHKLLLQIRDKSNSSGGGENPISLPFNDLIDTVFLADLLLECILISAPGKDQPINAAPMGIKLAQGRYLLVQPFLNTDTYANLYQFPDATINFTKNPFFFATCALQGWGKGPTSPELPDEELYFWGDFPVPSLREADLTLKCTIEAPEDVVIVADHAIILLAVQACAILHLTLPVVNRADNLALEAVVHATRVKTYIEEGRLTEARELMDLILRYEKFVQEHAREESYASRAVDVVRKFLEPFLSQLQ